MSGLYSFSCRGYRLLQDVTLNNVVTDRIPNRGQGSVEGAQARHGLVCQSIGQKGRRTRAGLSFRRK